jgi:hypothetical protein
MKAILEFNLPEDSEDFDLAKNGPKYKLILDELDNYLRAKLKYEDLPDDVYDELSRTREKLNELCQENNLSSH